MKMAKRLAAILLAVIMLIGMTACGDTSWIVKYGDGNQVPTGVYTLCVLTEYASAYANGFTANGLDTQIQGTDADGKEKTMSVSEYIMERANEDFENYVAVKDMCEKEGIVISQSDYDAVADQVKGYYNANIDTYTANGVSEASFNELMINHALRSNLLYDKYCDVSNSDVSEADIKAYYEDNYLCFNYMLFNAIDYDSYMALDTKDQVYVNELMNLESIANQNLSEEEFLKKANDYSDNLVREGGSWYPISAATASSTSNLSGIYSFVNALEIGESKVYTFNYSDMYNVIMLAQRTATKAEGKDYEDTKANVIAEICDDQYYDIVSEHYDSMGIIENANAKNTFVIDNLTLDGFTSMTGNVASEG